MFVLKEHMVQDAHSGSMLMDCVLKIFPEFPTRSSIKKAIKRGEILVNEKHESSGYRIQTGQVISIIDMENKPPKPLDLPLDIIFEDEHIAVINKPAGIEVSGNKYYSIQNALVSNISKSVEPDALAWAKPVHRLDYPTSGLLLIAKTRSALVSLGKQFENRLVKKRYRALVSGRLDEPGTIETDVNEQNALTSFNPLYYIRSLKTQWITEVDLFPRTGRKHQLRIHMASIGNPVVGEKNYGSGPVLKGKGLFLASVELTFNHPKTKQEITIELDPPTKFKIFMEKEQNRWDQQQ